MQYGIGFEKPAGHGGDDIDGAAPERRAEGLLQLVSAAAINDVGLSGIEQGRGALDGNLRLDRAYLELHFDELRNRGANLDSGYGIRETVAADAQLIDAWRQTPQ
jgi:hypothetical protein